MNLSMSPRCLSRNVSFNVTPMLAISPCRCPNSPSMRVTSTWNPCRWYICRIPFIPFNSIVDLLFGITSIVANLIFLDIDTSITTLLTYMMSTHRVTFWYRFRTSTGIAVTGESMIGGLHHIVFPFRDLMSGPKMYSAASTSAGVTGQFTIPFLFNRSRNVVVLGLPIVIWSSHALNARK